jgi:long-chain acyl-CoA synthetase
LFADHSFPARILANPAAANRGGRIGGFELKLSSVIDLDRHDCLQGALAEALARDQSALCLIEADRDRENARLAYGDVRDAVLPLAAWLKEQEARRVAIVMTNQSKWHISACAALWIGAELVPLDPKLSATEHAALLRHSGADTVVVEHFLWRDLEFDGRALVTEAPSSMDLRHGCRWEECRGEGEPAPVTRQRSDPACIVYSSGTGGDPKGCVLTHGNYLDQCAALMKLYTFAPGDRYLSILPTNHAIDFMVGFLGPYFCGATVVHLRTLRPEFVRAAFPKYRVAYMALVPLVLRNLANGLQQKFDALTGVRAAMFRSLHAIARACNRTRPRLGLSRALLGPVHKGFGGRLKALFVGGAFTDPALLEYFRGLGIPVANGYGLTEAGTVVTLNDFDDYRPDTVGKPLAGTEVEIRDPDPDGVGEVVVRGPTVMSHYHDDPGQTAATIREGWLHTGDLGVLEAGGHLRLMGRQKNMIVTAGGKNVYPEDIENAFDGLPVKEYCIFAEHFVWPSRSERLLIVVRPEADRDYAGELARRNRRLPDFKRVHAALEWEEEFPRTASLKIKRPVLAEALRERGDPEALRDLQP